MLPVITVIGNLKGIELKHTQSGKAVCKFKVECAEKNAKGEWVNLYLNGECWEKQAEFVNQYFRDGMSAVVTGKLFTNIYEKQDGTKVYETKFLFPSVGFVPKDKAEQSQSSQAPQQSHTAYREHPKQMPDRNSLPIPDIDIDDLF